MRIYIEDRNNLIKYNLPSKVDGSLLYTFKSSSNGIDNSINIDAENGKWFLKSNGNVNIIGDSNTILDSIELKDYMAIPLSISGASTYVILFCLPSVEENAVNYSIGNLTSISIGKSTNNTIVYNQNLMSDQHAVISFENNYWYISPASDNKNILIYLNNQRVMVKTPLNGGDIIFMNGLRIVWMKKTFIIPMNSNMYSVNNLTTTMQSEDDNSKYQPISELENSISLYNENEYFSHTPRIRSILEPEEIMIDSPPPKEDQESGMPFLLSIGTSFTMLGMMSLNAFTVFNGLYDGTKEIIDVLPQLIMIVTMLIGSLLIQI